MDDRFMDTLKSFSVQEILQDVGPLFVLCQEGFLIQHRVEWFTYYEYTLIRFSMVHQHRQQVNVLGLPVHWNPEGHPQQRPLDLNNQLETKSTTMKSQPWQHIDQRVLPSHFLSIDLKQDDLIPYDLSITF